MQSTVLQGASLLNQVALLPSLQVFFPMHGMVPKWRGRGYLHAVIRVLAYVVFCTFSSYATGYNRGDIDVVFYKYIQIYGEKLLSQKVRTNYSTKRNANWVISIISGQRT